MSDPVLVKHTGGCHCGAVRFEVQAPAVLQVYDCNCSICSKKQCKMFMAPKEHFTLLKGADFLSEYRFHTKKAVHLFCKSCGVQSFCKPRLGADKEQHGIMPHCLDPGTVKDVHITPYDGASWA